MTMWTRYCRTQAQQGYRKTCLLKFLQLRALHNLDT